MPTRIFEEARPNDHLLRLAASDLGKAYKSLAVSEMAIHPGDVVLGCEPGSDPDAVRQARSRTRARYIPICTTGPGKWVKELSLQRQFLHPFRTMTWLMIAVLDGMTAGFNV